MNGNTELLNFIYQNSQMGMNTINQLLGIIDDTELKKYLQFQLEEYQKMNAEVMLRLNENGYDEKGIGSLEKIKTYLAINMQTMTNKSASHVAQMVILGSNMGILDAEKNSRKYNDAEKDILNLLKRLIKTEEENVQELKKFL